MGVDTSAGVGASNELMDGVRTALAKQWDRAKLHHANRRVRHTSSHAALSCTQSASPPSKK